MSYKIGQSIAVNYLITNSKKIAVTMLSHRANKKANLTNQDFKPQSKQNNPISSIEISSSSTLKSK